MKTTDVPLPPRYTVSIEYQIRIDALEAALARLQVTGMTATELLDAFQKEESVTLFPLLILSHFLGLPSGRKPRCSDVVSIFAHSYADPVPLLSTHSAMRPSQKHTSAGATRRAAPLYLQSS